MSEEFQQPEAWVSSSNDSLFISLAEPEGAFTFKPTFTYPIFGDSEQIFGYKDLRIDLAFDCRTLLPFLSCKYSKKLSDDVIDIESKLLEFLPKEDTILKDESVWLDAVEKENLKFDKIPGEVVSKYEDGDEEFTIYKMKLNDENSINLHRRMQIFVLLFIEAGSYIDEKDNIWEIYTIYKKIKSEPESKECFVGFATTYSYWLFENSIKHDLNKDKVDLNYRKKISQFIILPPYQRRNHGKQLYNSIVDEFLQDDKAKEITVEDPSEAFDDLRDRCDLNRIFAKNIFKDLTDVNNLLENGEKDEWVTNHKITEKLEKRQFARLIEMSFIHILKTYRGKTNIKNLTEKNIRLLIKKRLYLKNKDALAELDDPTRRDKLQTAYERLREDYLRILSKVDLAELDLSKRVADDEAESSKRVKTE